MKFLLIFLFFPSFLNLSAVAAQELTARVIDAGTGDPIPYASVVYGEKRGVITNEEGIFSISTATPLEIVVISSLGYEPVEVNPHNLPQEIRLYPKSIELQEVFVSNRELSGKEIIKRVKAGIENNYNLGLTQRRFFFRESNINSINRFDLLVEKSSIPGIDQDLMSRIAENVPKLNDSYKEVLGDLYGDYDRQKVQVIKAANLYNPRSTTTLTELTDEFEELFRQNLKKNSYLKIRSGIIGFKVDAGELQEELKAGKANNGKAVEKTPGEIEEALITSRKNLQKRSQRQIGDLLKTMFWKSDIAFDLFEKTGRYKFSVEGYTSLDGEIVYILNFEPKRGADYKGKIFVNTGDFGVHRLEYKNVKPLKKFKLFGISTSKDVYRGRMIFTKDANGKYSPGYVEQERGESFGIDRPLTIIEKNKTVKGRRKQNELDLDIRLNVSQLDKYQLVVYESRDLDEEAFERLDDSNLFEYQTFKRYHPEFWQGINIMPPHEAIKEFTAPEDI